ncbi:MAG: hypothetical protein EOM74_01055 [Methanomicrobia archaeon]|nr:hypothetical protein [Methanomicrobia archaeon]
MASFSSGYKAEYVALINEVEAKMKKIIVDDIQNGVDVKNTSEKLNDLIDEFASLVDDTYPEKQNMIDALQYTKKTMYNRFKMVTMSAFYKAQDELLQKTGFMAKTPEELIGALMTNAAKLDINEVYDVTKGSTLSFTRGTPYIENYYNRLRKAMDEMVDSGIAERPKPTGSLSLRSMLEISIRQEFHENQRKEYLEKGVKLVWISTHADASERCAPHQGKLFSLDGSQGTIDGYNYQPIEKATDIFVTTKNGRVWKNGLFGFNCRHRMTEYVAGTQAPTDYDENEIKKEREITNKQRALERIVYKKRLESVLWRGVNDRKATFLDKEATQMFKLYQKYSEENNHAFYPDRCAISQKMRKYMRGKI